MNYLLGYKDGVNVESYQVAHYFKDEPPIDKKMSQRELRDYGFTQKGVSDYYIVRKF